MIVTDTNRIEEFYTALVNRDENYLGSFIVGVKTTSVCCIATCRARKPKKENVLFFKNLKDALESGFRPCKICKPTENIYDTPPEMEKAIQLVQSNPKKKITDQILRENNLSPTSVRRWFNKNYGITFHAYQRMYRINQAYLELKDGSSATDIAFNSSYESLSGFNYTFKKIKGQSPTRTQSTENIYINRLSSPIGPMLICATNQGICLLEFTNRKMLETELSDLQKRLQTHITIGTNKHIKQAKIELEEYFEGTRMQFEVPLHPIGTDFQKKVWNALMDIDYGKTKSYLDQAISIDNKKAVRAVANANGCNKIAIMIPCHRVIGSNGKLTGYGGGIERKRWLLEHEQWHFFKNQNQVSP